MEHPIDASYSIYQMPVERTEMTSPESVGEAQKGGNCIQLRVAEANFGSLKAVVGALAAELRDNTVTTLR